MRIVRSLPRRIVPLVVAGLVAAAAGAVIALARGNGAPTTTSIVTPTTGSIGTGVVLINTDLAYQGAAAAGTGMVLTSSGKVLTNNHVISGATTIDVVVPNTGHSYKARVVGYDRTADVALLQLQGAATGVSEHLRGIETNAGVQPGDSGGPLVNSQGQVVGMDTAASSGFGLQKISTTDGYAIPIAKALTIAHAISSGRASAAVHIGATAFLGVDLDTAGYGGRGASASGALITGVVSGGPAASAGLAAGDVITAINGHTVPSPATISALVLTKKPGAKIRIAYVDQFGTSHTASVTLASGPPQ
jgi:S1-C subfamily serine protease